MRNAIALVALSTILTACGRDEGSDAQHEAPARSAAATGAAPSRAEPDALYVRPGEPRPPCDAEGQGRLIYEVASAAFLACDAGGWATVDVKAPAGPKGDAGAAGAAGKDGRDGAPNDVVAVTDCDGQADGSAPSGIESRNHLTLRVTSYRNGDLFAHLARAIDVAPGSAVLFEGPLAHAKLTNGHWLVTPPGLYDRLALDFDSAAHTLRARIVFDDYVAFDALIECKTESY